MLPGALGADIGNRFLGKQQVSAPQLPQQAGGPLHIVKVLKLAIPVDAVRVKTAVVAGPLGLEAREQLA